MLLAKPVDPVVFGEQASVAVVPPPPAPDTPPAAQASLLAPPAPPAVARVADPRFPAPEGGFFNPLRKAPEAESGYLYRTTSLEMAQGMAEAGLGVEHVAWRDGAGPGRAYFSLTPGEASASVSAEGTPVLIRVPARGVRREPFTGALYRTDAVPAHEVEVLGADGKWYPLRTETSAERDERIRYEAARELVPEHPRLIILKDTY